MNTSNNQDYGFGNQFNSSLYVFRYFGAKATSFKPYLGVFFETAQKQKDGLVAQNTTGGTVLLGAFGTRVTQGPLSINVEYQNPLAQKFNTDGIANINAELRFSIALIFNLIGSMPKKDMTPQSLDY